MRRLGETCRVIVLETRPPKRGERNIFGRTYIPNKNDVFRVFLNAKQSPKDMFDTLIHELLHFVCAVSIFRPRMNHVREEARVRMAAKLAGNALRGRLPKNEKP